MINENDMLEYNLESPTKLVTLQWLPRHHTLEVYSSERAVTKAISHDLSTVTFQGFQVLSILFFVLVRLPLFLHHRYRLGSEVHNLSDICSNTDAGLVTSSNAQGVPSPYL